MWLLSNTHVFPFSTCTCGPWFHGLLSFSPYPGIVTFSLKIIILTRIQIKTQRKKGTGRSKGFFNFKKANTGKKTKKNTGKWWLHLFGRITHPPEEDTSRWPIISLPLLFSYKSYRSIELSRAPTYLFFFS